MREIQEHAGSVHCRHQALPQRGETPIASRRATTSKAVVRQVHRPDEHDSPPRQPAHPRDLALERMRPFDAMKGVEALLVSQHRGIGRHRDRPDVTQRL